MASENPDWGYKKIVGALENVGYNIAKSTVANILKSHGIEPSPDREKRTKWSTFLKAHWESLGAIDFTTIEVWTKHGLITYYLLFVMKVSTRKVQFVGCTPNPNFFWMEQKARNLTDPFDGFLIDVRKLILDRDSIFIKSFRDILKQANISCVRLPRRSPDLNTYIERFMKTIKYECLEKMVLFGEKSLRKVVKEFLEDYHKERNHQGIGNQIIEPGREVLQLEGRIKKRERLGGMLNYYYREAA